MLSRMPATGSPLIPSRSMKTRAFPFAPLFLLAIPLSLPAQGSPTSNMSAVTSGHTVPVPSARAVRRTAAISLDGRLDDQAWQAATPVTEFTQTDPDEGQPATERTEMRFLFDEGALYVGAK